MKTALLASLLVLSCIMVGSVNEACGRDPGIPDTVSFGEYGFTITGDPFAGALVLPLRLFTDEWLVQFDIPLRWTGNMLCDSVEFTGERFEHLTWSDISFDNESRTVYAWGAATGDPMPAGEGVFAYLYFSLTDTGFVSVDSTNLPMGEAYLHFYDSTFQVVNPQMAPFEYHITAPRDSVILEQLVYEISGPPYQGTAVLPVRVAQDEYLYHLYIPLRWTGSLVGDSGRFAGVREPYIEWGEFGMASKSCWISMLAPNEGPFFPPIFDTIGYLYFTIQDTGFASVDTCSGGPSENFLHFLDSNWDMVQPYVERPRLYHIVPPYVPGDVNYDWQTSIGDAVYLLNYLYRGMAPPVFFELGDANGDCAVDLGDVIYLLNYLYKAGPAPQSGCLW